MEAYLLSQDDLDDFERAIEDIEATDPTTSGGGHWQEKHLGYINSRFKTEDPNYYYDGEYKESEWDYLVTEVHIEPE